jgi:hypothetical protein
MPRYRCRCAAVALLGLCLHPVPPQAATAAPPLAVEGLAPVKVAGLDAAWRRPGIDLARYSHVTIDPIELALRREPDRPRLDPADTAHAMDYLRAQLTAALGDRAGAEPPESAAPTLRLHIVLTDYRPNRQWLAWTPSGRFVDRSVAVGAAAFQAELIDTESGAVVAAFRDRDEGAPFDSNVNLNTFYGDADRIMRRWAARIAEQVR